MYDLEKAQKWRELAKRYIAKLESQLTASQGRERKLREACVSVIDCETFKHSCLTCRNVLTAALKQEGQ